MKNTVRKKLEIINNDANQYGETIFKNADKEDVLYFEKWWSTEMKNIGQPKEYLDLIKEINNFDYDGLSFYSIDKKNDNNFYKNNEIYWENEYLREYIFLGEDSISWYCQSLVENHFLILDKPSGSIIEEFETLSEMIIKALESIL